MKYEVNFKELRNLRHKKGITLEEVSKDLHVSISRLSRYERGKDNIPMEFLVKLCNYYEISVINVLDITYGAGEDRIRNPERISEILAQLALCWSRHPDYRLFQLLNAIGFDSKKDNFYVEDEEVLKQLYFANGVGGL